MTTVIRTQDLSCPSCVDTIEKTLTNTPGVRNVEVHFNTGRIEVDHDPEKISGEDLVELIGKAGYTARVSAY